MRSWLRQALISVGSASAAACLTYALTPAAFATGVLAILFAHEVGHWYVAHLAHADPDLPFFIPIGIAVIGVTRVHHSTAECIRAIAIAGPMAGLFVAGGICLIGAITANPWLIMVGAGGAVLEAMNVAIGSDATKLRNHRGIHVEHPRDER